MNHIPKEFLPSQIGKTRKIFLKNGSSISTKWKKENEYIIRYKPENYADYYSPYFLFKFKNGNLKKTIPFPNKRSFIYILIILIGFIIIKNVSPDLYLTLFSFSMVSVLIFQVVVGIASYQKIRNNVFKESKVESKNSNILIS